MFALRTKNFNWQDFMFHNKTSYGIGITINQVFKLGNTPLKLHYILLFDNSMDEVISKYFIMMGKTNI